MTVLVTGAAGFIGMHVSQALLARGERVIGLDCLNDYYDPRLKHARLAELGQSKAFTFIEGDIADRETLDHALLGADSSEPVDRIVHLAAQAGVRYSIENADAYGRSNLVGHLNILEACRTVPHLKHLVYASSSSVYGGLTETPFREDMVITAPVSFYAATKVANEVMSQSYAHLYKIPQTGLRFFTVYGPWGRPDMAPWLFTDAILNGRPIRVFNNGDMWRDFTFVDDIVAGVLAALDRPAAPNPDRLNAPHRIYNLGNNRSVPLMDFISAIEAAAGVDAQRQYEPMQPGDVYKTEADLSRAQSDLGFSPKTKLEDGIPQFVDWFRRYTGL